MEDRYISPNQFARLQEAKEELIKKTKEKEKLEEAFDNTIEESQGGNWDENVSSTLRDYLKDITFLARRIHVLKQFIDSIEN